MHASSLRHYANFIKDYCKQPGKLLDVGAEGCEFYKIAKDASHEYLTLNTNGSPTYLVKGDPYNWNIENCYFDYVISSSTFEHIEFPWLTFLEMVRVTKKDGYIYINAPSCGDAHWDWDGWRYYKGSMEAFAKWGKVKLINAFVDKGPDSDQGWHDCVGIFQK